MLEGSLRSGIRAWGSGTRAQDLIALRNQMQLEVLSPIPEAEERTLFALEKTWPQTGSRSPSSSFGTVSSRTTSGRALPTTVKSYLAVP